MPDVEQGAPPEEERRVSYGAPTEADTISQPIGLYWAFLAGGALITVGLLGFIPPFTKGGALFDIMRVTTVGNFIHLLTGLLGMGVFFLRKRRYATIYAALLGAIYLIYFSNGNVAYGNIEATFGPAQVLQRIQWITFNAFHAGMMLASWLVAGLSAMQRGDRATRAYRAERRWFWESRTPTQS